MVNIIELTAEWNKKSPEERALAISNIDQVFPNEFLPLGQRQGTDEAQVTVELRTQNFVQLFEETIQMDSLDSWVTVDKINETFKLNARSKGKEPENVCPSVEK